MIALLALHRLMDVAERAVSRGREQIVGDFDLLQAKHIGRVLFQEAADKPRAQADGVDVPGGEFDRGHETSIA